MMRKCKFQKYKAAVKQKEYVVMIPEGIKGRCKSFNYHANHCGAFIDGDRKVLEALMAASYILGKGGEILLYFPTLNNEEWECEKELSGDGAWGGYMEEAWKQQDEKELVIMNHTLQFPIGRWKEVKSQIAKKKPEMVSWKYEEEKVFQMFDRIHKKWLYSGTYFKKERFLEKVHNDTAFYVISKGIAQEWFLKLSELLGRELERNFPESNFFPFGYGWVYLDDFHTEGLVVEFYDDELYREYLNR